jgi:hypothetical protein
LGVRVPGYVGKGIPKVVNVARRGGPTKDAIVRSNRAQPRGGRED